ncbi:hypothetical protein MPSI1_002827 [Malassezia psittaci]|uniref:XPG-I domain-containing protein n=1 Tax=Malassezia psittaci TaxID=1821823 RepID=A0AAF0JLH3_9BASI|nr:hypothetical protein MPSI1_002827 [Malassezia psittaci]
MGVPGLWNELAEVGLNCTLSELVLRHWNDPERSQEYFRLGIDASVWLYQVQKAQGGKNPELRTLFFRLARILHLPIRPIFVFDGPERPDWKRDARVYKGVHLVQEQFCGMLNAFGTPYWAAPGEAEAELAWMNHSGIIDAVLTDDVDALMLGAQVVVRSRAWQEDRDTDEPVMATVYDRRQGEWRVDSDGMILAAMLSGGDYDTRGMAQCGIKTALSLSRCGYGSELLSYFREAYSATDDPTLTSSKFEAFLLPWRQRLCTELRENRAKVLPRKLPKLADSISEYFLVEPIQRQILFNYAWPKTSCTRSESKKQLQSMLLRSPDIHLHEVASFAQTHFQWAPGTVLKRLSRLIFPGLFMRELYQAAQKPCPKTLETKESPMSHISKIFAQFQAHSPPKNHTSSRILQIHSSRTNKFEKEVRVSYDCTSYANLLPDTEEKIDRLRAWVPVSLLLSSGDAERKMYRGFLSQQQRKSFASPTKKIRSADQTTITSYFTASKSSLPPPKRLDFHVQCSEEPTGCSPAQVSRQQEFESQCLLGSFNHENRINQSAEADVFGPHLSAASRKNPTEIKHTRLKTHDRHKKECKSKAESPTHQNDPSTLFIPSGRANLFATPTEPEPARVALTHSPACPDSSVELLSVHRADLSMETSSM